MDSYRLLVDVLVRRFSDEGYSGSTMNMTEIEKLESEWQKLCGIENWKIVNLYKTGRPKTETRDDKFCASYAVRRTMNIVCSLLFSAIFYPDITQVDEEVYRDFSQFKLLASSPRKLVCCFSEERRGFRDNSRPVLAETKMAGRAVEDFKVQMLKGVAMNKETLRKSIDSLQNSSLAVKEGLQMFDSVVNELFQELVKRRNKILDMVVSS